jgi:hypothetical protein
MKHEIRNPKSEAGAVGQVFNLPSIARQVKNLPHGTPPCSCAGPNVNCTRSGLPMLGRLYEICAGINCSPQMSEHYRRLWDARHTPPCMHLGAASGRAIQCPTCAGATWIKTFWCDLHETCTTLTELPGLPCCATCPDHTEKNPKSEARNPKGAK